MANENVQSMDIDKTTTSTASTAIQQEGLGGCNTSSSLYPRPGSVHSCSLATSQLGVTRKRGRDGEEVREEVEKRGCEEGMSWWTCLMLEMDQENTKSQVVRKVHATQR